MGQATGPRTGRGAVLLNALIRPLAAATLAVTIIVAALTGWWWFLLVGGAFYAILVWSALQDKQLTAQVLAEELYPTRNLDLSRLQGPYRDAVQRALAGRQRIEEAVATARTPSLRENLAPAVQQVAEVTERIYDIARKAQDLQTSLGQMGISIASLENEIQQLEFQARYAKDEYLRGQYQATLEAKREQASNLSESNQALLRWQAQLDNALSALDTIYSQVLKIKSAEVRNLSAATDEVAQSLQAQINELRVTSDAFDQVYKTSSSSGTPPANG